MERKPIMYLKTINNGRVCGQFTIENETQILRRSVVYLSGAYGEIVNKEFIEDNNGTTLKFQVQTDNNWVFDTTIENFDIIVSNS